MSLILESSITLEVFFNILSPGITPSVFTCDCASLSLKDLLLSPCWGKSMPVLQTLTVQLVLVGAACCAQRNRRMEEESGMQRRAPLLPSSRDLPHST